MPHAQTQHTRAAVPTWLCPGTRLPTGQSPALARAPASALLLAPHCPDPCCFIVCFEIRDSGAPNWVLVWTSPGLRTSVPVTRVQGGLGRPLRVGLGSAVVLVRRGLPVDVCGAESTLTGDMVSQRPSRLRAQWSWLPLLPGALLWTGPCSTPPSVPCPPTCSRCAHFHWAVPVATQRFRLNIAQNLLAGRDQSTCYSLECAIVLTVCCLVFSSTGADGPCCVGVLLKVHCSGSFSSLNWNSVFFAGQSSSLSSQ